MARKIEGRQSDGHDTGGACPMPLDETAPQLDALLLGSVLEMELSARDNHVASKRYNLIPEHLQRPSSPIRRYMDTALVYPQGSRAIGATVVHGADDDRFDLDAVLEFRPPRRMDTATGPR